MPKPPVPASTSDSSTAMLSVLPNTTKLAPELPPFGSSWKAPMIRSSNPSPFTSPAELTDMPDMSSTEKPLMMKPPVPASTSDSSTVMLSVLPNTTKLAPDPHHSDHRYKLQRSRRQNRRRSRRPLS